MESLENCIGESIVRVIDELVRNEDIEKKTEVEFYDLLTMKYGIPLDCAFEVYESLRGVYKNDK